jgi:PAS domain S-box-containing protein
MRNNSNAVSASVADIVRRYGLLRDERLKHRIHEELLASGKIEGINRYTQPAHETFVAVGSEYISGRRPATSDISNLTGIPKSSARHNVSYMEWVGILALSRDPNDGRRNFIELTKPYQKIVDTFVDECANEFSEIIDLYDKRERDIAANALARTNEELRESEKRFKALFEQSGSICMILDPNTPDGIPIIIEANKAAYETHGYTREDFIGRPIADVDDEEGQLLVRERTQQILKEGFLRLENVHVRRDGTKFPVAVSAFRVDTEGAPPLIFTTEQDITERRQAEKLLVSAKQEAETANTAKSEFLASMSHDLRTPLNAIVGFSEMMTEQTFGPLGDPHYEEYGFDIRNSGRLLLSLIDDILDLSKIEAGKYNLVYENLSIPSVIQESIKMLTKQAEDKKINLVNSCKSELPMLRGDQKSFVQIFNNLLSNSIKFTPERGGITINAWKDRDNGFNFQVSDTGIGMSKEELASALSPFEQANNQHSRKHEGTGLGLHLSNRLIELHGGEMTIESEPDKGTTVTVRFPSDRNCADD